MAEIKQVGVGRRSNGKTDGVVYYNREGKTYARAAPIMPSRIYKTEKAKLRIAIWNMIQMHMRKHYRTIVRTVDPVPRGTCQNNYMKSNYKALKRALQELAPRMVAGEDITITEVEAAIATYAAAHPTSIKIGIKADYELVYLTGQWPERIEMHALRGDGTIIVFTDAAGVTTTIDADGNVTIADHVAGDDSGTTGGAGTGSSTGGNTGGSGSDTPGGSTGGGDEMGD
ncbi:MAG: hypothetical protein HUK17_06760 [Bacteroidales bacterium]|nr:hypothetical protein [Bacteroidales bacterium]